MPEEVVNVIAQVASIIAMIVACLSYQQKSDKGILAFQLVSALLFFVNFFLLRAYAGAILNIVSIIRGLVFIFSEKTNAKHPLWVVVFTVLCLISYALSFTVFGMKPTVKNCCVELLPVIGMIISTVSFRFASAKKIRFFGLFASPLWLAYNIVWVSIGAICSEIINLASIVIGIIRYDSKKKEQ